MRGAWTIARVELQRLARERTLLFFALVLPVVITVVIGMTMFSEGDGYDLGVSDEDGSEAAAELVEALAGAPGAELHRYDDADALRAAVRRTTVDGGVIIPAGFGDRLRAEAGATVTLVGDPADDDTPVVRAAVAGAVDAHSMRVTAARFVAEHAGVDGATAVELVDRMADDQRAVGVRTVDVEGGDDRTADNAFDYTAPSNLVLFVFINSLAVGAALVESRRLGIVRRVLSTPTAASTVVAGAGLSRLVFALAQAAILLVTGALLFGVTWGDPLAAAVVVILFALVSTGAGLLIGATVDNAEQAQAVGIPAAIALGMLGGCMWPLFIVPDVMRVIGHVTPHAWAMDAWVELIYDGGDLGTVATEVAVLAAFAVVLCGAATVALGRSIRRA